MTTRWLALLADASIRALVIAVAVALVLAVFRIRNSSTRHIAWAVVVMTMLLMPMLVRVAPPVRVQFPDLPPTWKLMPVPPPPRIDVPVQLLDPSPAITDERGARMSSLAAPAANPAGPRVPLTVPVGVRWTVLALSVYLTGLVLLLARWLIGLLHLSKIRKGSQSVEANIQAFESALVAVPVTVGLFRPRVILPLGWREWTADTLTAVLAHECAHVERRDPLVTAIARLNCAIFWFHPVAWWLEAKLATLAEHACDDAALKQVARQQYADTLLDIAATVRRHQGRLVWQGVGVDGDGRLGQRIDRVLSGASWPVTSRTRRALVAASCAVVIAIAVACRQETKVEPLREDPVVAARLKANAQRMENARSAEQMTLDEAASLEDALKKNPEDMATREKLLMFYRWTGRNRQPWADNVAARKRHALWLVRNHPDSDLLSMVHLSMREDPAGYAEARRLWLTAIAPRDVNPKILSNAAWFFSDFEQPVAEKILLRAKAQQPNGPQPRVVSGKYYAPWSERLGQLYASAIAGRVWPYRHDESTARQAWARDRLERSSDGQVLSAAGLQLTTFAPKQQHAFGRQLIERAGETDFAPARTARDRLRRMQSESRLEAPPAANATGPERVRQLAAMALSEYTSAEYFDWPAKQLAGSKEAPPNVEQDKRRAAEGFANAKEHARQALDLASSLNGAGVREATFCAHVAYGLVVLRGGDRKGAVNHMQQAATLPPPDEQRVGRWASCQEYRLVFYLLKQGERQTIIDYFERAAPLRDERRRKTMLAAAAAIRDGRMPEHYQQLLATGSI